MVFEKQLYEIEFTDECLEEIKEIYEYISKKLIAKEAAKRLMKIVKSRILNLSKSLYLYMKIGKTDKLKREYHRIIIKNYVILYTIDENNKKVFISHMIYGKRNYL